jgi:hypothetical protein
VKRVTAAQLEAKAAETNRPIEFDNEQGVAILKVGRGNEWYAALDSAGERK